MAVMNPRTRNGDFFTISLVNLDAVTTATNGDSVDMTRYTYKSIFVNVSVNTGAVTVNIEASHDGTTWFDVRSQTYTSVAKDIFSYSSHFPFMRTTTTTQSNSTVTVNIVGKN